MSTSDIRDWSVGTGGTTDFSNGTDPASAVPKAAQGVSNTLEYNTAQEPVNSTFRSVLMAAAGASILASLTFQILQKKNEALFVGQWAPTFLLIALWGQLVKTQEQVS